MEPEFLISESPLHCVRGGQSRSLYYALAGFQIPSLPTLPNVESVDLIRRRFSTFLRSVHSTDRGIAVSLIARAEPKRLTLGTGVDIYLLCRVAAQNYSLVVNDLNLLVEEVFQIFPTGSRPDYAIPTALSRKQIEDVLFHRTVSLNVVRLQKYIEVPTGNPVYQRLLDDPTYDRIPHPYRTDLNHDPWLAIIETLSGQQKATSVVFTLEPISLNAEETLVFSELARHYEHVVSDGTKQRELMIQGANLGLPTSDTTAMHTAARIHAIRAQWLTGAQIASARRGAFAYANLVAEQDQLFAMNILIACAGGSIAPSLLHTISGGVSMPVGNEPRNSLGWHRPHQVALAVGEQGNRGIQWLDAGCDKQDDFDLGAPLGQLPVLTTVEEAIGLFHVPVLPASSMITSVSAHAGDVPFTIPTEVVAADRYKTGERLIHVGSLYQRNQLLKNEPGAQFYLKLEDLEKPSLLAGAPGSGKSNLALCILSQLWRKHRVPFLVLDPSNGHEYRYLLAEHGFSDDLVVYTAGDRDVFPLRFNPFDVPPGVTVQAHITRLLACFKAAYEMWDPLPAIYESALLRLYTQSPFEWNPFEKGNPDKQVPCMADFAQSIIDELEENVLPDYGSGTEAGGILTGASKIRVNGILRTLGHILNVRDSTSNLFQNLLQKPVVIELGAVGDPDSIALVMAFLISQLAGHIEYAYPRRKREDCPHILLIDEAHRLLSSEMPASAGINQGNRRGKSAEELNVLLAEMRKFRQGIMILDQRPSSLVGGVLDNSYVNIMCRLNDENGFVRLADSLNLSQEQRRYARTRLKPGDALLMDRATGQPLLTRSDPIIDKLREEFGDFYPSTDALRGKIIDNAIKSNLTPPQSNSGFRFPEASRPSPGWKRIRGMFDANDRQRVANLGDKQNIGGIERLIKTWIRNNNEVIARLTEIEVLRQLIESVPDAAKRSQLHEIADALLQAVAVGEES